MSPTYVKLVISPEGPTLAGTGVTLDSYLDGLRRIVFVDDRGDLARVEPGDLVVALGGGGGSAESLRALADLLEAAGAVGVLVHERSLADQIDAEGTSGDFPVFLVGRDVEWPEVLQPLLDLDALLRHRSHNPELRRRILMRQIIEMRGVTPIDPRAATEAGVDLEEALYRVIVVVPGLCTPEEVRRLEEEVGVDVLDHDPVGVVFPIDDVMVAVQTGSSALLGEDWLPDRLLSKARLAGDSSGVVGVGRPLAGADGIFRSFREASWAARVSRRLEGGNRVARFSAMGAYAWLEAIDAHLSDEAITAIRALMDHDARHPTNLVETLRACVETRQLREAAQRLFLHRNSLRYRLDLIRKVTGLDPREPEDRLVLQLQLRLALVRGLLEPSAKAETDDAAETQPSDGATI